MVLGELNLRKGDVAVALSDFYRIAATQDDFIVDYYLGVVYLLQGETDLALSYLVKSREKNSYYLQSNLLIAVIHLLQHDYAMASKYATWAVQLAPDHVQAHTIQGLSLYFEKRFGEALQVFDRVAELSPESPIPYFFKALALIRRQMPVSEERVRDLVSYIHTTYLETVFLKLGASEADWHAAPHRMRRFIADLSAYVKIAPSLIGALLVADYYQRLGALKQAEASVQEALALREDCAFCYYKLAYLANLRHDREQAIELLQRALELDAQLMAAHQALGSLYEQEGQYAKAVQSYERGLKVAPDHVTLLNNLGWLTLVRMQDPATAYVYIRKAASLAPDDPDVRDSLAWWYYQNGDIERAVLELQTLVRAHPAHALYQYHAGMAYLAHGEFATGQQHLRLALRHGLSGEAAARARERLP